MCMSVKAQNMIAHHKRRILVSSNSIPNFPDKSRGGTHNCESGLLDSAPENIWAPQISQQEQARHSWPVSTKVF